MRIIIIVFALLCSSGAFGQREKDQFTSLIPFQSPVDFGSWDGSDVAGGSIIPDATEGFCIVYNKKQGNTLHQVDYDLTITGPVVAGQYTISNGTSDLPITFVVTKDPNNIATSSEPLAPWAPGYTYNVAWPNPATANNELTATTEFPGGCTDAKFYIDISISGSDLASLPDPVGFFTGSFVLAVNPIFSSGNIKVDNLHFDVQIAVISSVYITQLAPSVNLATTLTEDFCIWSFGGEDVSLTIAGTETAVDSREFSLVNRDAGGTAVDTIGYNVQLDSLRDGQTINSVNNGGANSNLPTVPASENDCSGSNGLNYRLTFDVENKPSARPGDYSDTLVLTAAPM
jgi:hypothetical protein